MIYSRAKNIAWNEVEDGAVVLAPDSGQYLHLDGQTCSLILQLESGKSLDDCVHQIVSGENRLDYRQVYSDYEAVVTVLLEHGVLEAKQ